MIWLTSLIGVERFSHPVWPFWNGRKVEEILEDWIPTGNFHTRFFGTKDWIIWITSKFLVTYRHREAPAMAHQTSVPQIIYFTGMVLTPGHIEVHGVAANRLFSCKIFSQDQVILKYMTAGESALREAISIHRPVAFGRVAQCPFVFCVWTSHRRYLSGVFVACTHT